MTTEDDFNRKLDADPDDHHTRLVYADWLQERGDPRADGYRALGRLGLRPYIPDSPDACPWFARSGVFSAGLMQVPNAALPAPWYDLVELPGKSHDFAPDHDIRTDATRREVEDAAAMAYFRLLAVHPTGAA